jgi:hypothetical protein
MICFSKLVLEFVEVVENLGYYTGSMLNLVESVSYKQLFNAVDTGIVPQAPNQEFERWCL